MEKQKYTLITGATSGIGLELAKLFASIDHNLILVARNKSELNSTQTELSAITKGSVQIFSLDLSETPSPQKLCEFIREKQYFVNVLVNDAGQGQYGKFAEGDLGRYLEIINLNIFATTAITRLFLPDMIAANEGKILNLASVASEIPGPWQAVYHATKAYVLSLSEALTSELQETAIIVTALQPGVTDTDFFNKAEMQDSKAVQDKSKMADPAKVAKDGFDALMSGKDKIVSGMKNKFQTTIGNVLPDSVLANQVNKQQEPVNSNEE